MKNLIWTPKFIKSTNKFIGKNPELVPLFKERIKQIEENPFEPALKTHKLKGNLSSFYSASLNFNFRILFQFDPDNSENIILHIIGSHDEVY